MTTQQKTAAIQAIVANHQDNQAAVRAANVNPALQPEMSAAMTNAMKGALEKVFAPAPAIAQARRLGAVSPKTPRRSRRRTG